MTNDPSVVRQQASWASIDNRIPAAAGTRILASPPSRSRRSLESVFDFWATSMNLVVLQRSHAHVPLSSVRTRTLDHTTPKVSPCPLSTSSTVFFAFLSPFRTATSPSRVLSCLPAPLPNLRASLALEPCVSDFRHVRPSPPPSPRRSQRRNSPSCLRSS